MNLWTALEPSQLITLSIIVPLIGAALVVATGKNPNLRETVTITTAVLLFSIVLGMADNVLSGIGMVNTSELPA